MHDDENVEVEVRAILWRYLNVEGHSDIGRGILERVHSFHFTVWNFRVWYFRVWYSRVWYIALSLYTKTVLKYYIIAKNKKISINK